jgi:hypothetical protein
VTAKDKPSCGQTHFKASQAFELGLGGEIIVNVLFQTRDPWSYSVFLFTLRKGADGVTVIRFKGITSRKKNRQR